MAFEFPNSPANGEYANGFVWNAANQTWDSAIAPRAATIPITSPNYAINGAMDIWQRGTSFSNPTNNTYTADRWQVGHDGTGATRTVSQQAFTPGSAPAAAIEGAYFLRYAVTAAGTGNTYQNFNTVIEDIRTLAGQVATFSFWAKADAPRAVEVILRREWNNYAGADQNSLGTVTLTTSWARYSLTYTVPATTGLTIGINSSHKVIFRPPAATALTVDFWGVQVEAGAAATDFRRNAPSIQAELAACQRYYWRKYAEGTSGALVLGTSYSSSGVVYYVNYPVTMRVAPTAFEWTGTASNYRNGAISGGQTVPTSLLMQGSNYTTTTTAQVETTGASGMATNIGYILQGNTTGAAYLGFSAEL